MTQKNGKNLQKTMKSKESLSKCYKANQCTDLNDVSIAIEQVESIGRTFGYTKSVIRRLASLHRRRGKLMFHVQKD